MATIIIKTETLPTGALIGSQIIETIMFTTTAVGLTLIYI